MIRARFTEQVGGERVTFALPISALRVIARTEPKLYQLAERLRDRTCTLAEVEAVLNAAADGSSGRVIEAAGLEGARAIAVSALWLALTDEPSPDDKEAPSGN